MFGNIWEPFARLWGMFEGRKNGLNVWGTFGGNSVRSTPMKKDPAQPIKTRQRKRDAQHDGKLGRTGDLNLQFVFNLTAHNPADGFRVQLIFGIPMPRVVDSVGDGISDSWRQQFFGGSGTMTNDQSCVSCDPDGDGVTNFQEFSAGTNPTNRASVFRIVAVAEEGDNVRITWAAVGGKSYSVQGVPASLAAVLIANFTDLSPPISVPGVGESTTNYLDLGGVLSAPVRYYRVRLGP